MIKAPSDHLLDSLEELVPSDFEKFKFKLQNTSLEKDHSRIPRSQLQNAKPVKLATLMITHYGEEYAVRLTLQVLRAINQNFLAEELDRAIRPEYLIQESGPNSSAMSCSSGENKPKGLRIPDGLEGDRQRQSGDGALSLPPSQHEAGRGPQKKPQGKPRDQKGSEGLDVLGNFSTAMAPGKPQDEAVYPLCRAQEGDDSCRYSVASRYPKTSGKCSPSSFLSLASLTVNNSEDYKQQEGLQIANLSPKSLPQCERHMKQVQLLFCEDHKEPICLICRLSQEHQGHWVRPIEEAALEYKEQIQKQLEHLKELRKSGEEQRSQGDKKTAKFLKQTETQKQRHRHQLEKLYHLLEQQEKLFVASIEDLNQTIGQVREKYSTQVSRDIALLDELIGELEAKQYQPEWELMQDIGVTLYRVKMATVPKPWNTPPEVEKKIHLIYQKSEFVEKSIKSFSETLRSEMDTFNFPELICAQAHAVNVILDAETAHPNLIFSNNLKSVRLGNKCNRLPDNPERFDSCIIALGFPSFLSGRHYWEVEVGNKTGWILGICKASASRKGSMTLSPDNGYWVVMMMKRNEYQVSTIPPTRLQIREPPRRVGIFLDYKAGEISFYNVTYKSLIYTFTSFSSSGPLQPMFSPGTHDGGKNTDPLTICPVGDQGPH
ncbi:pyrin isoform X5 [Mirounga angustirostris]|uniref:pyrin isoform X5 n=1 Tax=Mirounga angustirostris TaxID=9716 RepID=UPI001E68A606|nr:pyrin isoform X3 [Mirounga angustirostris]